MNAEKYSVVASPNYMVFDFISDGPRGKIKKQIQYAAVTIDGLKFYNIAFGDLNDQTGDLDDFSRSMNGDRDKILATVAATVLVFTEHFPDAVVYASGSTPSRSRLYQMAIAANFDEICKVLTVYGIIKDQWLPFVKNVTYEGFAVMRT